MPEQTPKSSNGRSVVSCDGDSKAVINGLQVDFMKTYGAQVSQEKIVAKMLQKSRLKLADLKEFAPVISESKAA